MEFAKGDRLFPAAEFRDSVRKAGVEVLAFQIDACGLIEQEEGRSWLTAGRNRFLLVDTGTAPIGSAVCASGRLLDQEPGPHRLRITSMEIAAAPD